MTDEQRQREEIAGDEQWLRAICAQSAKIDTARIKRAVHIAVEEQWLRGNISSQVPADLPRRVRLAIQQTLADAPVGAGDQGRNRVIRVWAWMGVGLAAAAAIGLAVIGLRNLTPTADSGDAAMNFATAFEQFPDNEELDQELSKLRDAFSELDRTVAQGWGEDPWEEPIDESSVPTEDGV